MNNETSLFKTFVIIASIVVIVLSLVIAAAIGLSEKFDPKNGDSESPFESESHAFPESESKESTTEETNPGSGDTGKSESSSALTRPSLSSEPSRGTATAETPTTETPTTETPTTEAPTTEAPTTEAPTTEAPTTDAPTTNTPVTTDPVTTEPYITNTVSTQPKDPIVVPDGKKLIALSFDDGPNKTYTPQVLDVLKKYNIHATFFVQGYLCKSDAAKAILQRMVAEGHDIGSHTYDHPNLKNLTAAQIAYQERTTSDLIYAACGVYPTMLRPPYGGYNASVQKNTMYPLIRWSVDTYDWQDKSVSKALGYVKSKAYDGGIILMHDRLTISAAATEAIIVWLQENGYMIVSVSELMEAKGIEMKPGGVYFSSTYIKESPQ